MLSARTLLLVGHIGAAILLIGPTSVAASLFPRYLLEAGEPRAGGPQAGPPGTGDRAVRALHRITRGYGTAAVAVPAIGVVLAAQQQLFGQLWVQLSLAAVAAGGALLWLHIIPTQQRLLDSLGDRSSGDLVPQVRALRATTGLVSLSWVVVLLLMVAKPG